MRSNGQWNDYSTQYQYGVAERAPITPHWVYNPATGHFYALTDTLIPGDAEAEAQYWGAHLVTINDQADNDWIRQRFPGDRIAIRRSRQL